MQTVIEHFESHGMYAKIFYDEFPINPREEFDNLGTMLCSHPRYQLGDEPGISPDDAFERLTSEPCVWLNVFMYEHSGIALNTSGFQCPWDSGQVGVIYITYEQARHEYGWKRITERRKARLIEYLKGEVETYSRYLNGEVYGYTIENSDGEELDGCWGFYGIDDAISEANNFMEHV